MNRKKVNNHLLLAALDFSYDGIHILDKKGDTMYINEACERIEGINIDEVMSHNIKDLVEKGVFNESVTLKVLEEKAPVSINQRQKNGKYTLVTGTPIYSDEGDIEYVIVNSRDITDLNAMSEKLSEVAEQAEKYREEVTVLRREQFKQLDIVSSSSEMKKVFGLAATVAAVDSNVLITGESGVGKGVIAKYIHNCSDRDKGPFITVDCSAIPESLFESELFGYEKGAFTGASSEGKIGLLELGNGGTVFLDEIAETPLSMQAKLLRAIQEKKVMPVGGKKERELDVRIVAATNRNIAQMVKEGDFREDLFYRLNVVPIKVPPLRDRPDDIIPLIINVSERINNKYNWSKKFDSQALSTLAEYKWEGNVRELENVIERVMVSAHEDSIGYEQLPEYIQKSKLSIPTLKPDTEYKQLIADFDKAIIEQAIKEEGSIVKAAKRLDMHVTTLRRKLYRYNEQ